MGPRLFLILLLVIHPVRGLVASTTPPATRAPASCVQTGDCCPLCVTLDACPCAAEESEQPPAPEPLTRPVAPELARALPGSVELIDLMAGASALPGITAARAPPGPARTVGDFLSMVCVRTT